MDLINAILREDSPYPLILVGWAGQDPLYERRRTEPVPLARQVQDAGQVQDITFRIESCMPCQADTVCLPA